MAASYKTTDRGTRYDIEIVVVRKRKIPYVIFDTKQAYNLNDYSIKKAESHYLLSIHRDNQMYIHE